MRKKKARPHTKKETRELLLSRFRDAAAYWAKQPDMTPHAMCDSLVVGILSILDGVTGGFPPVDMTVCPHASDKQSAIRDGENYHDPEKGPFNADCYLHDHYYKLKGRQHG